MEQPRVPRSALMTPRSAHDPGSRKVARGVLPLTILARSANQDARELTRNRKAASSKYMIGSNIGMNSGVDFQSRLHLFNLLEPHVDIVVIISARVVRRYTCRVRLIMHARSFARACCKTVPCRMLPQGSTITLRHGRGIMLHLEVSFVSVTM